MERYSSYKDSGVSWIGDIPEHWSLRRIKYIFSELKEKSENGLEFPLSLSKDGGIIPFNEKKNKTMESASYVGGKIVHKGEIVFNRFKARLFAVSGYDGIVSSDYAVYKCNRSASPEYLIKLFGIDMYRDAFNRKASGIGDGFSRLYTDDLFAMYSIFPSLAEQEKIVGYLEDKTSKIDAYVSEKEKEILLLQELKQKTIADAVTKGLNPDVKMKDSSSLISTFCPASWKIVRNKSFMSLTGVKVGNRADEYVLLSLTTKGIIVRDLESGKGKFPKDFDTYQFVRKGELVFCLFDIDETPRTVGLVDTEGMLTGAYTALKVNTEIALPEYIYNYYLCVDNIKALKPYYSGLRKTVRADKFLQIYIPLPPLDEQRAIVSYIEEKCQKIDSLTTELQSEIDYLKEYKQRLIADCVTGQVNVQKEVT